MPDKYEDLIWAHKDLEQKELDALCTDRLDWHQGAGGAIIGWAGYQSPAYWYDAEGKMCAPAITDSFANLCAFSPSCNRMDALLLEDEFDRRGLGKEYVKALDFIVMYDDFERWIKTKADEWLWRILQATPKQRTRAFLAATSAEHEKTNG